MIADRWTRVAIAAAAALAALLIAFELSLGVCVQEDAFISFRYAHNAAAGHGFVYNPGERVEGYTNFLWTALIAVGIASGLDPVPLSRGLGIAASLALVAVVFAFALARDAPRAATAGLVATAVVASSRFLASEAVQGLETALFALLVTAAVLVAVSARDRAARAMPGADARLALSGGLFAVAALTRPEAVGLFALTTAAGLAWRRPRGLARHPRGELASALIFLAIWGSYWAARTAYYGYPFPNTFYAKTGGGWAHVARGLAYEGRFLVAHPTVSLLSAWALAAGWSARRRRPVAPGEDSCLLPTLLAAGLGYAAYVAAVGGDFKPTFRFVLPMLGLWAVAIDEGISRWAPWPSPAGSRRVEARRRVRWGVAAVVAALLAEAALGAPALLDWTGKRAFDLARRTAAGRFLAEHAPPDAVLAIHSAGIVPYYAGLVTIDMWGLSDLHIAHRRVPDMGRVHPVGHEKSDPAYVFSRRPTYYVDERYFTLGARLPDLRDRVSVDLRALGVYDDYQPRFALLTVDDAGTLRRYWFHYLERVAPADRGAAASQRSGSSQARIAASVSGTARTRTRTARSTIATLGR